METALGQDISDYINQTLTFFELPIPLDEASLSKKDL
jgi:hypothetical protein